MQCTQIVSFSGFCGPFADLGDEKRTIFSKHFGDLAIGDVKKTKRKSNKQETATKGVTAKWSVGARAYECGNEFDSVCDAKSAPYCLH